MLEYLITGTGRCGTVSLYVLLNQSGIKTSHELLFNPQQLPVEHGNEYQTLKERLSNTEYRAESCFLAVPYLGTDLLPPSIKLVHLTRDPLLTIKSFMELGFFNCHLDTLSLTGKLKNKLSRYKLITKETKHDQFVEYIQRHAPHIFNFNRDEVTIYMKYYVVWNQMILDKANAYPKHYLHKIEEPTDKLCEFLEIPKQPTAIYNQKKHSKKESLSLTGLHSKIKKSPYYPEFREFCMKLNYEV